MVPEELHALNKICPSDDADISSNDSNDSTTLSASTLKNRPDQT